MELGRDFYVGVVEENVDPIRKGRIKVRVQTLYHSIPVENIPWAYPFAGIAGKEFQVPAIGKLVNLLFFSDDLYSPYYIYSENYNVNLQNKIKTLNDEDYVDFGAILFDEITQIFIKHKELTIDLLLNKITIDENTHSINLELKDNKQILNLGSRTLGRVGKDQQSVLGTNYFKWMDDFMKEISNPMSLIGNQGKPVIKSPKLIQIIQQYFLLRPNFVSNNVFIVDNGAITILKRNPDTDNRKNDVDLVLPIEVDPLPFQILSSNIASMNDKACQNMTSAKPTTIVPLVENLPNAPSLPNGLPGPSSYDLSQIWDPTTKNIISKLHPDIIPYVIKFFNKAKGMGIILRATSGYRSFAAQQTLVDNYGIDPSIIAKPSAPGNSMHNYGLAIDVASYNQPPDWQKIGAIGESIGFRWGGWFPGNYDPVHFDMSFGYARLALKSKVLTGDVTNGFVNLNIGQPIQQLQATNYQYNSATYSITNNSTPCDTSSSIPDESVSTPTIINTPLGNVTTPISKTSTNITPIVGPDRSFYEQLLAALSAPVTDENLKFLYAWRQAEHGGGTWNPFNTTLKTTNSTTTTASAAAAAAGVQNYTTAQDGINATVTTLLSKKHDYSCIVNGLRGNIGSSAIASCSSLNTWGSGTLIAQVLAGYDNGASIKAPPLA